MQIQARNVSVLTSQNRICKSIMLKIFQEKYCCNKGTIYSFCRQITLSHSCMVTIDVELRLLQEWVFNIVDKE